MTDIIDRVHIDGIGPVVFRKSQRASRIVISVSPFGGVRVSIPSHTSITCALEFVDLKKRWILKHKAQSEQYKKREDELQDRLSEIEKKEAADKLIVRLCYLAEKHGFNFNRVTVREQRTRWGACSSMNNISLNLKLILLPEDLIDYVILHELVHTRFHNHSNKFWAELDKYVSRSKFVSKRLKTDGLKLS